MTLKAKNRTYILNEENASLASLVNINRILTVVSKTKPNETRLSASGFGPPGSISPSGFRPPYADFDPLTKLSKNITIHNFLT